MRGEVGARCRLGGDISAPSIQPDGREDCSQIDPAIRRNKKGRAWRRARPKVAATLGSSERDPAAVNTKSHANRTTRNQPCGCKPQHRKRAARKPPLFQTRHAASQRPVFLTIHRMNRAIHSLAMRKPELLARALGFRIGAAVERPLVSCKAFAGFVSQLMNSECHGFKLIGRKS